MQWFTHFRTAPLTFLGPQYLHFLGLSLRIRRLKWTVLLPGRETPTWCIQQEYQRIHWSDEEKDEGKHFQKTNVFFRLCPNYPPSPKCFLSRKMSSLKYRSAKLWRVGWWGVSQYWEHSIDLTEHTRPVLGCKKPPALFWLDGTRTDLKRAAMLGAGLSARREQGGCFVRGELPSLYPTFQNKICLGKWP